MEGGEAQDSGFFFVPHPPSLVSLHSFTPTASPTSRRLSSNFVEPSRPVRSARKLAWVDLKGRLVGADEASSARTIGGGLDPEQSVAWDLFSPIHRILIVAVVAVAASKSKRNKLISDLKKSVEHRDQVLLNMQEKLDKLCEQVNSFKEQPEPFTDIGNCFRFSDHHFFSNNIPSGISSRRTSYGDENSFKSKPPLYRAPQEQEERRMSDLSDWCSSSVSSFADLQLNSIAIEPDIYNIKKDCEEKDATIKELSDLLQTCENVSSKRVEELEETVRKKNLRIRRLKKDMMVLEQKVLHLTRLRRPSFSGSSSGSGSSSDSIPCSNRKQVVPVMSDNILYNMDSTTSPSSSDCDGSPTSRPQPVRPLLKNIENVSRKQISDESKIMKNHQQQQQQEQQGLRPVSPLKERRINQRIDLVRQMHQQQQTPPDSRRRRKIQNSSSGINGSKNASTSTSSSSSSSSSAHKRWV